MPKKPTPVPITGAVLKWAIREAGLTEEDFAELLRVPAERVYAWEEERARPGKTEFGKIVSTLKRPSAVFLLAGPPERPALESQFRVAPGAMRPRLTRREADGLRLARRLQRAAAWVMEELGQDRPKFPSIAAGDHHERAGLKARAFFNVPADVQVGWRDYGMAFRMWQQALEVQGIPVFRLPLGPGNCRGFSLWDERVPLIVVNTSGYNVANRIYTLIHEYAHILLRTNSVCATYTGPTPSEDLGVEQWAERFAAAFLLPREHLQVFLQSGLHWRRGSYITTFQDVEKVARRYKVSLRAAALRLIGLGAAKQDLYTLVDRQAQTSEVPLRGGGTGQKRSAIRLREYGSKLTTTLLIGMRQGILERHDVLDYLGVATSELEELEQDLLVAA